MRNVLTATVVATLSGLSACTSAAPGSDVSTVQAAIHDCYETSDPTDCLSDHQDQSRHPAVVIEPCFDEHLACVQQASVDPFGCDQALDACLGIFNGDPTLAVEGVEICFLEAEQCTLSGAPDALCMDGLDSCLAIFDANAAPPQVVDLANLCFEEHVQCVLGDTDPATCDQTLDACLGPASGTGMPVATPDDPCVREVQLCFETSSDPLACKQLLDYCFGGSTPCGPGDPHGAHPIRPGDPNGGQPAWPPPPPFNEAQPNNPAGA